MQLKNFNNTEINTPSYLKRHVELVMNTLDRIHELLELKYKGRQKDLAKDLGVSEAAVSKMINGIQNFSFLTIAKLEEVFNEPIIHISGNYIHDEYVKVKGSYRDTKLFVSNDGYMYEGSYREMPINITAINGDNDKAL